MKRSTEQPWWINAHERPDWFHELCEAFVDAELCDWSARRFPHPQDFALVALHWFTNHFVGEALADRRTDGSQDG